MFELFDFFVLEPHQSRVFRGWPAPIEYCKRFYAETLIVSSPLKPHLRTVCAELGIPLIFGNISIFIVYFVQHIRAIKIASISQLFYLQAIFEVNELIFLSVFYLKAPKAESLLHNFFGLSSTNLAPKSLIDDLLMCLNDASPNVTWKQNDRGQIPVSTCVVPKCRSNHVSGYPFAQSCYLSYYLLQNLC